MRVGVYKVLKIVESFIFRLYSDMSKCEVLNGDKDGREFVSFLF